MEMRKEHKQNHSCETQTKHSRKSRNPDRETQTNGINDYISDRETQCKIGNAYILIVKHKRKCFHSTTRRMTYGSET